MVRWEIRNNGGQLLLARGVLCVLNDAKILLDELVETRLELMNGLIIVIEGVGRDHVVAKVSKLEDVR